MLGNGTRTDYAPADPLNRTAWVQHSFAGSVGQLFEYRFDAVDRRRYERRNWNDGDTDGFGYDRTGQVTGYNRAGTLQGDGSVSGGSDAIAINYDANGNRTSITGTDTRSYGVNDLSQYTNDTSLPVEYDVNGNLSRHGNWWYFYDAQNRLTGIHDGVNYQLQYWYDGLNRQILRNVNGDPNRPWIYSTWAGWNLTEEWNVEGQVIYTYTFGAAQNEMVVRDTPTGDARWYYQDGRANTSHISDNAGTMVERYTYSLSGQPFSFDRWGTFVGASQHDTRLLFAGADYVKQTGMYDMRNRFYHVALNRFAQPDPIGFAGDPTNLYRYCGGDSVNFVDPSGLEKNTKMSH